MRFLPLVSSRLDPGPWLGFRELELAWEEPSNAAWASAVRGGLAVHGVHLQAGQGAEGLVRLGLDVLKAGLEADFLVLPADPPATRWGVSKFLGALEALLEASSGRGMKIVLRPAKGATPRLLELLGEAKGDAISFCWDGEQGDAIEPIADRLTCAVGTITTDPRPLQRWGYRWNLAIPADDPATIGPILERMRQQFPPVLFPAEMPATALGRPVLADPEVSLGRIWDRGEG